MLFQKVTNFCLVFVISGWSLDHHLSSHECKLERNVFAQISSKPESFLLPKLDLFVSAHVHSLTTKRNHVSVYSRQQVHPKRNTMWNCTKNLHVFLYIEDYEGVYHWPVCRSPELTLLWITDLSMHHKWGWIGIDWGYRMARSSRVHDWKAKGDILFEEGQHKMTDRCQFISGLDKGSN